MTVPKPAAEGSEEERRLPPMGAYVFGVYRRAPDRPEVSEAEAARLQEAHLAHLRRLRERGDLILSGPLLEAGDLRGVAIFRTDSLERAREWSRTDPLLERRLLILDLYALWAPAGLQIVPPSPASTRVHP